MLIPLGVLSLGAVFSGMIWYGDFFGDHDKVNKFYGIPAHAEATESHGDATDETHAAATTDHGTSTTDETTDGATDHGQDTHAVAEGWTVGSGALYMGADNHVLDDAHHAPKWVKVSPFVAMLSGLILAIWFYVLNPTLPGRLAATHRPLYLFLLNKWYFDEIYNALIIKPVVGLGRFLWKRGDGNVIDGFLNGVAMGVVPFFTRLAGRAQTGYIFTYAFWMVLGIVGLVTWMTLGGGGH